MKRMKIVVLAIALAISSVSFAQDAFKVLINKGKNEVKSGATWIPVKTGSTLKSNDELKVVDNAYLGLVSTKGVSFEVKASGKYKVSDLSKEAEAKAGTSVMNKYTDFILSSNDPKKNTLTATGAVVRGTAKVDVFLPENGVLYNNVILVNWDKTIAGPYIVQLTTMFDDELATVETADNFIQIDLGGQAYVNEDNILVRVTPKSDRNKASEKFTLKHLSKPDQAKVKASLDEISSQTSEQTALNKLILAGFFEENGLFVDAATQFQEAIKLAPDVPEYQAAYNDFLLRHRIKEAPVKK